MPDLKTVRQPPPKADGLMPDFVRIPHRFPEMAETSGRDLLADDVLPYTRQQVHDACRRAVAWRVHVAKSQGAGGALCSCITYQSEPDDLTHPGLSGWMRVGWINDPWIGGGLRIFWHPATNRVQVDRPPQQRRILITSEVPDAGPATTYMATFDVRADKVVTMHLHPLRSDKPIMTIVVPTPKGQPYWVWAMNVAAAQKHELRLPETFPGMDAPARRALLIRHAYVLAARIARR